jgi:hypothetical protein
MEADDSVLVVVLVYAPPSIQHGAVRAPLARSAARYPSGAPAAGGPGEARTADLPGHLTPRHGQLTTEVPAR